MRIKNLSLLALVSTFVLIIWGAVVHNTESSLACPDWPLCYNQFFPKMEGGILVEHGHRLLAALVGFLSIILVVLTYRSRKKSRTHFRLYGYSLLALFLVIIQGVLGGITVIYRLPTIVSTSHLGLSLIFFLILIYIHHLSGGISISLLSRFGQIKEEVRQKIKWRWRPVVRHGLLLSLGLLYIQIILGAFMRHAGAGTACGLGPSHSLKCMDYDLWQLTFWPGSQIAQLHMVHRLFAVIVAMFVLYFSYCVFRFFKKWPLLRNWALFSLLTIVFQVSVGVISVALNLTVVPTTLHLAGAALSLASIWKLSLLIKEVEMRFYSEHAHSFFSDLVELTKPRLSLLVMVTALVGTVLAPGPINFFKALLAFSLITLVVTGSAALNCYIERDVDRLMVRTSNRPLPAHRMRPRTALLFGTILLFISIPALCIYINTLTAVLAFVAAVLYLYAYTPLKLKNESAVYMGAIPGALPPVMGWTAVTGKIDIMTVTLFLILFIWQLPHFLAISLYHSEDYRAANIKIYPHLRHGLKITKAGIFVFTLVLFAASLLPSFYAEAGPVYTYAAILLSTLFTCLAVCGFFIKDESKKEKKWARSYFYGSLMYLPLLLSALIFLK